MAFQNNSVNFDTNYTEIETVWNNTNDTITVSPSPVDYKTSLSALENFGLRTLPIDMKFNGGHCLAIILYSLQMIISAIGNIYVFSAIVRLWRRGKLSRINLFLLHLTIADLLVTFLMMPLEIAWNATVTWDAGDGLCRGMAFFRIFGLYLSGFVLICISLDRYFSVIKPLNAPDGDRRARIMLLVAWVGSVLCSLPQVFIFHLENHPEYPWYEQCVTFNFFPTRGAELSYNLSGFFFLYVLPLTMIVFSYSCILCKMYSVSKQKRNDADFGRSNMGALSRAKTRTLKMTVIIVAAFFLCWTPYNIMSLWHWFDKTSAQEVDQHIQKGLFIFACTNSCVNPIIYGVFHFRPWQKSGSAPPSVPQGSRNVAVQSENSRPRIYWTPNQCCVVECESSEDTCGSAPGSSSFQTRNNHGVHTQESRILQETYSAGNFPGEENMGNAFQMEELGQHPTQARGEGENCFTVDGCIRDTETPRIFTICETVRNN